MRFVRRDAHGAFHAFIPASYWMRSSLRGHSSPPCLQETALGRACCGKSGRQHLVQLAWYSYCSRCYCRAYMRITQPAASRERNPRRKASPACVSTGLSVSARSTVLTVLSLRARLALALVASEMVCDEDVQLSGQHCQQAPSCWPTPPSRPWSSASKSQRPGRRIHPIVDEEASSGRVASRATRGVLAEAASCSASSRQAGSW